MPGLVKCYYLNCANNTKNGLNLSFFRFPVQDKERCITWLMNSGRDDLIELPDKSLANRRICSQHFSEQDFTNELKNKLLKHAIPTPLTVDSDSIREILPMHGPVTSTPHPKSNSIRKNLVNLATKQSVENHEPPIMMTIIPTPSTSITPPASHSKPSDTAKLNQTTVFELDVSNSLQEHADLSGILPLKNSNNKSTVVTPRKKVMMKYLSNKNIHIRKQKKLIRSQKKKIKAMKKDQMTSTELASKLSDVVTGEVLTFMKMQLVHSKMHPWSEDEKNLAMALFYKSPSTYKFLRARGFILPCISLIRKWINICNLNPGFTEEVMNKIAAKVKTMTEHQKECILMWDEISIKKGLQYDPKNDLIDGFEDLGPLGRTDSIATHALVFMLRGLKDSWKLPVAYVLSSNSIKKQPLALLIDMTIDKVFDLGFRIRAVVCDQGTSNAASFGLVGATMEKPFFFYKTNKIYCFFDTPHLIKSIRNTFLKYDILVADSVVKWSDVEDFYDIDKNNPSGCRAAPKLSERHIHPHEFHKMKVSLAMQVFSRSTSKGIEAAYQLGQLKSETALSTANFLGRTNDIIDCLNSRYVEDRCPLRRPISKNNPQVKTCLIKSLDFVRSWKINQFKQTKKSGPKRIANPPCFKGVETNIIAALSLQEDMETENGSYLLTGKINQDPLENSFGAVRQRGGYNKNPTSYQLKKGLQQAISVRLISHPETANCERDEDDSLIIDHTYNTRDSQQQNKPIHTDSTDNENLLDIDELFQSEDEQEMEEINTYYENLEQPTDILRHEEFVTFDDSVISYLAGWLGRKCLQRFSCEACKVSLFDTNEQMLISKHVLIRCKRFLTSMGADVTTVNGLKIPSSILFDAISISVHSFKRNFPTVKSSCKVHAQLCAKANEDLASNLPQWYNTTCYDHRRFIIEHCMKTKLFYTIKWMSQDMRDAAIIFSNNGKRKSTSRAYATEKPNEKLMKLMNL